MDQEKFGQLIKEIRKKYNLTQKELADKYNVTYQAVSKWENGKNLPDMELIKKISDDYNIDISSMLDGKYKKNKNIIIYILLLILVITVIIFGIVHSNEDFESKGISAACKNFNISGVISYNQNKSSIYISKIDYSGDDCNDKYKIINCTLFEVDNDTKKIISKCDESSNISLKDYLDSITLKVDNYSQVCKKYTKDSLYLEIEATNENDKIITYKVPLTLDELC